MFGGVWPLAPFRPSDFVSLLTKSFTLGWDNAQHDVAVSYFGHYFGHSFAAPKPSEHLIGFIVFHIEFMDNVLGLQHFSSLEPMAESDMQATSSVMPLSPLYLSLNSSSAWAVNLP
jgi:hypothetical protein